MNYEERCAFAYDTIERLKETAVKNEGTYNGVTVSITFEKGIPSMMRKEMQEIMEHNDLIFRVIEFKSRSLTVEFKGRTVQMLANDIYEAREYEPGYWEEGTIIDEDESVRWNRERVEEHNKEEDAKVKRSQEKVAALEAIWKKKIYDDAREELGKDVPSSALDVLYADAYNEGHSSGYMQISCCFDERVHMVGRFLEEMYLKDTEEED